MRNCSPALNVSNASRSNRFFCVLGTFLLCPSPPSAFGMASFTIAILITQVLGYVLALVGLCLCIMGESYSLVCVWFRFSQVRALVPASLLSSLSSWSSSFLNCVDFSYTNRGFIGKPGGKYRDLPYTPAFSVPVHPQLSSAFHTHTVGEPTWHPYQPKLTAYIMVGYWCCTGHSVAVTDVQPTRMPIVVSHGIFSVFCLFICPSP